MKSKKFKVPDVLYRFGYQGHLHQYTVIEGVTQVTLIGKNMYRAQGSNHRNFFTGYATKEEAKSEVLKALAVRGQDLLNRIKIVLETKV